MGPTGAGALKDRVRFERREATDDGAGNRDGAWAALVGPRRVQLTPIRGGVAVIAERAQGANIWDLWVRFDDEVAEVRAGDRVIDTLDERRQYAVRFAEDMERRREWILMQLELGVAT